MMTAFDLYTKLAKRGSFASKTRYEALAKVTETMAKILPASAIRGYAEMIVNHPATLDETDSRAHANLVIAHCEHEGIAAMDAADLTDTGILIHVLAARGVVTFLPQVENADMRAMLACVADLLLKDACFLTLPTKPIVDASTEPTVLTP